MRKLFLFLLLTIVGFAAGSTTDEAGKDAELYADAFRSEGDIIYATGNVVLAYDGTLFIGERARYDRAKKEIVVEGNVEVLGQQGSKVLADRVVFEVEDNRVTFSDFYHTDRDDIWVYADDAEKEDGNYTLRNSILSSCSPDNPDWTVRFKEAHYDSRAKYMRLKGVKFYAKDVPVFYTPYLGFSLDRQRSSGFLMPHFGLKKDEGFIYAQPYFWAISPSMDLEITPQIRTRRGAGLYGTFRFVDGPSSHGVIRMGYFRDRESYTREFDLKNRDHYGFELLYESSDILGDYLPEGYREGFYANLDFFNDIDYHNLQFNELSHLEETSRYKESRINYFLYNDRNYFGLGARYFIDTSVSENNETIQELPTFQYHHFTESLIDGWVDYSFDAQFRNYYREDGPQASRLNASLPLSFHMPLFSDFLNLSIEEEFAAADTHFSEDSLWNRSSLTGENHYAAATLHHSVELSTDLTRAYETGIHTMLFKAAYTKTTLLAEGDLSYDEIEESLKKDFDLEQVYDARVALSMHHFWQSYDGLFDADYLLVADYFPSSDSKWNQLRQELHLKYGHYSFRTRLDYSIQQNLMTQFSNTFSYQDEDLGLSIDHTRRQSEYDRQLNEHELGFDFHYRQSELLTWYGGYTYDLRENSTKDWKAGVGIDRKCWNFTIVFKQELTPVLKENGGGSIRNNAIYFRFNLVPFGGVGSSKKTTI
ncbi:LPS-assembly protein LptD [Nitratifractor sp.]